MTEPGTGVVAAVGRWPRDAAVVERAVDEAERRAVTLTLLHVDQERFALSGADQEYVGQHVAAEHEVLVAAGERARSLRRGSHVQTALYVGSVTDGILRTARTAAVVVLGAEGAAPVVRAVRGGVTATVAARATSQVEVVPTGAAASAAPGPVVDRIVLVATADGQQSALESVGAEQASRWGAPTERVDLSTRSRDAPLPPLGARDLVVVLRGASAPLWGRPDAQVRRLLDGAPCAVLVVPPERVGPPVGHAAEQDGAGDA